MEIGTSQGHPDAVESAIQALSPNKSNRNQLSTLLKATRKDPKTRARLADHQVLHVLVQIIDSLTTHASRESPELAIRCLANACTENETAKDEVTTTGFHWATRILETEDENLHSVLVHVLYNICDEHDASQQAFYREKLHYNLIKYLASDPLEGPRFVGIDVLFSILGQKAILEPTLNEPPPEGILSMLLSLSKSNRNVDIDVFGALIESTLVLMRDEVVQDEVVKSVALFDQLHEVLASVNARRKDAVAEGLEEDVQLLKPMETSLLWILSDCAARPRDEAAIALCQSRSSDFINFTTKQRDSNVRDIDILLASFCQEVGNVIRNVDSQHWAYLVERERLHTWLYNKVVQANRGSEDALVLHSVAGFLVQLTRASERVCEMMVAGNDKAMPAIELLCRHEQSEVRTVGIQLLKKLGTSQSNRPYLADLGSEVMTRMKEKNEEPNVAENEAT